MQVVYPNAQVKCVNPGFRAVVITFMPIADSKQFSPVGYKI